MNRSTTLKVLRNFGSTISKASILLSRGFKEPPESLDAAYLICLEWYLTEYCLESLREIKLYYIEANRKMAFEATGVQFPNVEKVSTFYCHFADNFSFNANFPNVQSLSLKGDTCTFNVRDWHFPTVKHLYFDCYRYKSSPYGIHMIDLIEMFKRQPQLEKLKLSSVSEKFRPTLAKCFNEFLPKLLSLSLDFINIPKEFEAVHFDHITDFRLCVQTQRQHQKPPFTFNRLESVEISLPFVLFTPSDSAALISEFISKNKHLKTINLRGMRGNFLQLFEFEHILLNVEELSICAFQNVPSDVVERFLTQSRSLKVLRICGIDDKTNALESKISEKRMHVRNRRELDKDWEFVFRL